MRIGSLLLSFVGLGAAVGSVYFAHDLLNQQGGAAEAAQEPTTVQVVFAAEDIPYGAEIQPRMLGIQPWPRDAVPIGAFGDVAAIVGPEGSLPRRAKAKIFRGELVIGGKLSGFGEQVTIVQKLGENTRAMSIKVDAVTAVGGFVTPGDFVDILLTTQETSEGLRAVTILQNIRVIGVDQQSAEDEKKPEVARTITVEVTPEQGQKLALAQRAGTLSLTLRTLDNVVDRPLDMIQMRDLLQEKSPVEEEAKKPVVRVRRGVAIEDVAVK